MEDGRKEEKRGEDATRRRRVVTESSSMQSHTRQASVAGPGKPARSIISHKRASTPPSTLAACVHLAMLSSSLVSVNLRYANSLI